MPGRQPLRLAAIAVLATALAGCGGERDDAGSAPVPVPAPSPSPAAPAAGACARLAPALPRTVDDAARRPAEPVSDLVTVWGDPPVVLRCGVPAPAGLRPMSQLQIVNGVDWFLVETPLARVFTTTGRVANVELTVPLGHEPTVGPLVDVAAAVTAQVPTT